MNLFNYCILWLVKLFCYAGVIIGGMYNGSVAYGLIGLEKQAEGPAASGIIFMCVMFITWLLGISLVNLWKIKRD